MNFGIKFDCNMNYLNKFLTLFFIVISINSWSQNNNNELSDTLFKDSTKLLKSAFIRNTKKVFERKIDRYVFNVENSIISQGGDAIDALKNTPGVKVQNELISIIGKGEVSILIDDRMIYLKGEDLAAFLHSISANDIKYIEVITNPPSKYDAQGSSGLINIQLKKGRLDSWNNSFRTAFFQNKYSSFTAGNTYNYNKNKFSLGASFDFKKGSELNQTNSNINYPTQNWMGSTNSKNQLDYISGRLSFDYQLKDNKSIGFQYIGNYEIPNVKDTTINRIFKGENYYSFIKTNGASNKTIANNSINIHYNQLIDTLGRKFTVDFDVFNYFDNQVRNYSTAIYDSVYTQKSNKFYENSSKQKIYNYSTRIDFIHPSKIGYFTYGLKAFYTNSDNNYNFYNIVSDLKINDTNQSNSFIYFENTQSIYGDLFKEISSKVQVKFGLRIENTIVSATSITYNTDYSYKYLKLFPTLFLNFQPKEKHTFNFTYDRRINRPSFWELNPFRWYINQYSYAVGNPYLKPSFTNNFELNYDFKEKFIANISASITDNGFGQVPIIDQNTNQQIYTRLNYYKSMTFGASIMFIYDKFDWFRSMNQAVVYYIDSKITQNTLNIIPFNGFNGNISSSNSFYLNKKKTISSEVNFNYTPQMRNILQTIKPLSSFDLGIRCKINRYQLAFYVNDLFKNSALRYSMITSGIEQNYYQYSSSRFIRLSFKYTFGNKNIHTVESENVNEEIKNRTNKRL